MYNGFFVVELDAQLICTADVIELNGDGFYKSEIFYPIDWETLGILFCKLKRQTWNCTARRIDHGGEWPPEEEITEENWTTVINHGVILWSVLKNSWRNSTNHSERNRSEEECAMFLLAVGAFIYPIFSVGYRNRSNYTYASSRTMEKEKDMQYMHTKCGSLCGADRVQDIAARLSVYLFYGLWLVGRVYACVCAPARLLVFVCVCVVFVDILTALLSCHERDFVFF